MKRKEFKQKLEEKGYNISYSTAGVEIKWETWTVARILDNTIGAINTIHEGFVRLSRESKKELLKLLVEYTSTPLDEREEEKRYYVKSKIGSDNHYINLDIVDDCLSFHDKKEIVEFKTKFTLKEIEEIKEKFNVTLQDCILVEVQE